MPELSAPLGYDRQKIGPLLAAVALVALPHVENLAPAVMAYFGLLLLWRGIALYGHLPLPKQGLLFLLTLAGFGLVLGHYHRFWGQEAGSSLFVVGLGLKLMELKTPRDAYLVVLLAFFVALTQYLFSQSLAMAGYTLAVVALLVAEMIGLNSPAGLPYRSRLGLALAMVAQAIPLMIALFLFFPRIPGPLWQLPDDTHAAKTGMGDTLSPGSIRHLAQSQETAFRIDFEGDKPPNNLLYWRGPVFWNTNGITWSMGQPTPLNPNRQAQFHAGFHTYTITLEPHNQRWVFALDLPYAIAEDLTETHDFQLLAKQELFERAQYRLSSATDYQTGPLDKQERQRGLQLPAKTSARLEALVRDWQREDPSPGFLVQRVLRLFREEAFYYTLSPPLAEGDPVEYFLLESRRGFCEHFATAFVTLMRLGGVPARVVTGYQGGHWNSVGRFLEVKQADAHAWAEVWLDKGGWTRIDPTAAVAPERIERGLDVESQTANGEIRFNREGLGVTRDWLGLKRVFDIARLYAASVDHAWNLWVLSYDPHNQSRLMAWLGWVDWRQLGIGLSVVLGLVLTVTAWLLLPRPRHGTDPALALYLRFSNTLQTYGLVRRTGEGARTFARRIITEAPELAGFVDPTIRLYLKLRYEGEPNPEDLQQLRKLVEQLPKRRRRKAS